MEEVVGWCQASGKERKLHKGRLKMKDVWGSVGENLTLVEKPRSQMVHLKGRSLVCER